MSEKAEDVLRSLGWNIERLVADFEKDVKDVNRDIKTGEEYTKEWGALYGFFYKCGLDDTELARLICVYFIISSSEAKRNNDC